MSGPRQTRLRLLFSKNETDVSEDLCKDLLSWSFTDHESGQADEISLTLKDNEGKWAGSWKPDGGENIKMYLSAGTTEEPGPEAFLGTFFVDYQRISGAPRVYELRAVSIPLNKPVRKTQKSRAWENHSLQEIAQEICRDAELELFFDSVENPQYQRIDQSRQSDMAFLQHLCEDAGLSIKVTDKTIVIFGQERYEKKDPVCAMEIGVSDILSYTFEVSQSDTYKAVKVSHIKPGQWIAIYGLGGLGNLALQYAKNVFNAKVIALDVNDEQLKLAAEMGADLTINSRSEDAAKIIHEKTGGAHAAVVTAVAKAAFNSAVDVVRAGGRVVAVGLPPEAMSLDIPRLVLDGIEVVGSLVGTRQDLTEAFQFAAEGKVVPKVTLRPLGDINAIFKEMEQGQIRGRMVIDFRR